MNWPTAAERAADIKANVQLSSVIGAAVDLRRSGDELVGCCPFHQERTPSFFVNDEKGTYYCFGCGASGDVITFLRDYNNMSFNQAIENLSGGYPLALAVSPQFVRDDEKKIRHVRKIWDQSVPIEGTPAEAYLESRAIPVEYASTQENLRFARISHNHSTELYPAMIGAVRNLAGEIVAIHRTYLTEDGEKWEDGKRALGPIRGGAVRFTSPDGPGKGIGHIHLVEGIEDALSLARIIEEGTVWATLGTSNMSTVELPETCKEVTIGHDNDEAGRFAALQTMTRLVHKGIAVNLFAPDEMKDWNEHLMFWELTPPYRHYNALPWLDDSDINYEIMLYEEGLVDE